MKFFILNIRIFFLVLLVFSFQAKAEEIKKLPREHEINFYSGMFDFSDDGKKSAIFGFQHQNENLLRDSFLGTLSPVTGALITADNATYVYTGVQAQYKVGKINLTPSFTPGLYSEGNGKDLGHIVEFKSEVQLSVDLLNNSEFVPNEMRRSNVFWFGLEKDLSELIHNFSN